MSDNIYDIIEKRDFSDKKILIVEDDFTSYFFLEELLSELNASITHAEDGSEAVSIAKENSFDLILMDMQMPNMDGYEATQLIKAIHPDVPIIAQTANALNSDKQKTIEVGCSDYISKPIMAPDLLEIINKYL